MPSRGGGLRRPEMRQVVVVIPSAFTLGNMFFGLWAIVSRWADIGSYRRAFNGTDAKLVLVPLLSLAIDEPSAYAEPASVGENRPRGTVG